MRSLVVFRRQSILPIRSTSGSIRCFSVLAGSPAGPVFTRLQTSSCHVSARGVVSRRMASVNVAVPSMGESVKDGGLGPFSKKVGDFVNAGEEVVQIETDKITHSLTAPQSGVITKILFEQGSTVEVGQIVFEIDTSAAPASAPQQQPPQPQPPQPQPQPPQPQPQPPQPQPQPQPQQPKYQPPTPPTPPPTPPPKQAPPPQQQQQQQQQPSPKPVTPTRPSPQETSQAERGSRHSRRVGLSLVRQVVAHRMQQTQSVAATLSTFNEIDLTNLNALIAEYKDAYAKRHGSKLGHVSFFVKAAVVALQTVPSVNAVIEGNDVVYRQYADVCVTVPSQPSRSVVAPVIRNCEALSIAHIEKTINLLTERARNGQLTAEDLAGGTFSIINGGLHGSHFGTNILSPNQSGVLGMNAIKDRVGAAHGKPEIRSGMFVSLTYDHRIIDGREAVTCLKTIKEVIEDPRRLLLEL